MIDTHSHIYEPEFDEDREEVVLRARNAGVKKILLPNINKETVEPMLSLCQSHPGYCYPMMGLHPEDVHEDYNTVLDKMESLLQATDHPYVAIGEVGLDLYWDTTYEKEQMEAFDRQIGWAARYGLPLMIHTRAAHEQLVRLMEKHRAENLTGVFHCFGGNAEEARQLLSFPGFALGIGGVVTFKKSKLPDVLAENVPLSRIVLETDCPYLAPTPYRGKRNETSYVVEVAKKLSLIYNVTTDEIIRQTTSRAERIFSRIT